MRYQAFGIGVILLLTLLFVLTSTATVDLDNTNVSITGGPHNVLVANGTNYQYNFTVVTTVNLTVINVSTNTNYTIINSSINSASNGNYSFTANGSSGDQISFYWENNTASGASGTLSFYMNLTSQVATTEDYIAIPFVIHVTYINGSTQNTTVYTIIDSQAPRFNQVNVTDGNTTAWNSTQGAETGKYGGIHDALGIIVPDELSAAAVTSGPALRNNINHTVSAEINDTHFNTVQMYYVCNSSTVLHIGSSGFYENLTMTLQTNGSDYDVYRGLINTQCFAADEEDEGTVFFRFAAYDLAGNHLYQNNTRAFDGVNHTNRSYEYILEESMPNFTSINITDSFGNIVQLGVDLNNNNLSYLYAGGNLTVTMTAQGALNSSIGALSGLANFSNTSAFGTKPNRTLFFFSMNTTNLTQEIFDGTTVSAYNTTSAMGDGPTIYRATITPSQINTSQGSYLNFAAFANVSGFIWATGIEYGQVGIDNGAPSVSLTVDKSTTRPQQPVTATCTSTDAISGTSSCIITLTKPNGDTVVRTSTTCASTTFTGTDTQAVGTYSVSCRGIDNVGLNATSTAATFTITTGGGGGGGGGGSSGSSTVTYDADLRSSATAILSGAQSRVKKIILSEDETHSIIFQNITATSVTLKIESEPQYITLEEGESQNVDLDQDGDADVRITLTSIEGSMAELTVTKLSAPTTPQPDSEEPETPEPEATPEAPEAPQDDVVVVDEEGIGMGTIIILIILGILIIGVIGFLTYRSKK